MIECDFCGIHYIGYCWNCKAEGSCNRCENKKVKLSYSKDEEILICGECLKKENEI